MNIDMIKDDVFTFSDKFFNESFEIIDNNFNFLEENDLIEPKENYFSAMHFLNTIMNHFTNLDYLFSNNCLKKLHRDINNLLKLYKINQEQLKNVKELFEKKFLQKNHLFIGMKKEILEIKKFIPLDDYDKETIDIIKKQYNKMKKIYFENFQDDFIKQTNDILNSLKNILNSKIYYFDKLLWVDANKSIIIKRLLKGIDGSNEVGSKTYIIYRLSIDLPYTDDYKYLQKCLRIYR